MSGQVASRKPALLGPGGGSALGKGFRPLRGAPSARPDSLAGHPVTVQEWLPRREPGKEGDSGYVDQETW